MSERTKKPLTNNLIEVTVHGDTSTKFIIPQHKSLRLFNFLNSIQSSEQSSDEKDDRICANEFFKNLDKKYGKTGVTIQGLRFRDGLTQKNLAQKLGIHQTHVSQIENGKRVVGKNLAQKLAKVFNTDYRLFL